MASSLPPSPASEGHDPPTGITVYLHFTASTGQGGLPGVTDPGGLLKSIRCHNPQARIFEEFELA